MRELIELTSREFRVDAAIAEFLIGKDSGTPFDRAAWLERHADLAAELHSYLADDDRLGGMLAPMRVDAGETVTHAKYGGSTESIGGPGSAGSISLPSSIGDYEILDEIARGGMGVVFKARQKSLNRIVALKMVLSNRLASQKDIERFHREAEAVAGLDHPNIAPVYEVGSIDGMPFFSMKLIEGGSLQQHKDRYVRDPQAMARLLTIVARAVHHAHQRGILHRDLKPSNVLLDEHGEPHVVDFGLAKRIENDQAISQPGAIVGTPSYMAPEQARGQSEKLTTAVDVYGLGVILYELLTGQHPFRGASTADTLIQVLTEDPVRPKLIRKDAPSDLETICLKCLEKDPAQRYGSAEALAEDLERWSNGVPIAARRVGRFERAAKWAKRNPVVAGMGVAVVLALTAGTTASYLKYLDAEQQRSVAEHQRKDALDQKQQAENEAAKAKKVSDFLISIFRIAETDIQGGNITARQILADAEKQIQDRFADQAELREELVKAIGEVKRGIARRTPQAMILEVRGGVQLQSAAGAKKEAVPQALVNLDDRLSLSPDAQVRLVFLSDFHTERLKGGCEATVASKSCEPANAVLERDDSILMTFVRLPKGTFYMGWDGVKKGVKTEIKEDVEIAVHAVTQGQWQAVMGENPSHFSRMGRGRNDVLDVSDEELKLFPVQSVSWVDAEEFIQKLNERERGRGYLYRLPSGTEWEYACRGGATSEEECSHHFYFEKPTNVLSASHANFNGSFPFGTTVAGPYLQRTTRVGAYPTNKLGLCDMHGNVSQWCADGGSSARVIRGGCWASAGADCRASVSKRMHPTLQYNIAGFRLARVPVQ